MITAYDFSMAQLMDGAGVDVILVGDSASNVMAGHETTLPITLDQMIYHAWQRGARQQARIGGGGPAFRHLSRQ
jgi:ketopantoate hydroxymethyltransferase